MNFCENDFRSLAEHIQQHIITDESVLAASGFQDLFVDAGPYLAMTILTFGILILATSVRESQNCCALETRSGRICTYAMKLVIPVFSSVLLPGFVILKNKKMRESITNRVKQSLIFEWIRGLSSRDQGPML